jgi:hypothetical protein
VTARLTSRIPIGPAPRTIFSGTLPQGEHAFAWNLAAVPDGRYQLTVAAKPVGTVTTAAQSVPVTVNHSLTAFAVAPALFSPNGDGAADSVTFAFTLNQSLPVQIQLRGAVSATVFAGQLGPGPQAVVWDGSLAGARVPDGTYEAAVTIMDGLGATTFGLPLTVDTTPPLLTLLDPAALRFQLNEAATVTATVNGQPVVLPQPQGVFGIPWANGAVSTVSAYATDAAGNVGATLTSP